MNLPPSIADYYRAAIEAAKKEVESTPDDRVLGVDQGEWANYLTQKYGMVEIGIVESDVTTTEVDKEYRLRGYDFYSDRQPGTVVRETAVRLFVPVEPTDTIQTIWNQKLAPNTRSISHSYPAFDYDHGCGTFSHVVSPDAGGVKQGLEFIAETVRHYNESIRSGNMSFPSQIAQLVARRLEGLLQKHNRLDELAAAVGIPLRKKADASTVVPTAPRVRAKIAPVLPPASKPRTRPVLEPDKFDAILDLLDNSARQFERTPQVFHELAEEGLRDIMLSNLNAVFEGAAGGETFQGIGKVDIHLRLSEGEVFVAEIKFWNGPESLTEVINQLRGRVTWRDSYGVAIVLSRNAGFTDVLNSVRDTITVCEGCVRGTRQSRAENHTIARFTIRSDEVRQATIHVLVYNLYTDEPGRRILKRRK